MKSIDLYFLEPHEKLKDGLLQHIASHIANLLVMLLKQLFHLIKGNIFLVFTTFLLIVIRYFIYFIFIVVAFDFAFVVVIVDKFTIIFIADQHWVVRITVEAINSLIIIKGSAFKINYFNQYLCIRCSPKD